MKVKELLKRKSEPVTIHAGKAMQDAMRLMVDNKISSLIIVDDNDLPVNIITERDIFHLAYRYRGDMMDIKVDGPREGKLFTGSPDDDILDIARMMKEHHIRHVPIMDGNNHLSGVISVRDIANSLLD